MSRHIETVRIPCTDKEGSTSLKVSVWYCNERKQYFLSMQPGKKDGNCWTCIPMHGGRVLLEMAKRFSQKRLEALAKAHSSFESIEEYLPYLMGRENDLQIIGAEHE
jgi:hypothetical protein